LKIILLIFHKTYGHKKITQTFHFLITRFIFWLFVSVF